MEGRNLNLPPNDQIPTNYGVGEMRGNQVVVCECYIAMMEMDDHL